MLSFAAWLLEAPVREARPLNVELPAEATTADELFQITLADGRELVLHIEFQGRGSRQPYHYKKALLKSKAFLSSQRLV
jgi:hypothetical protein